MSRPSSRIARFEWSHFLTGDCRLTSLAMLAELIRLELGGLFGCIWLPDWPEGSSDQGPSLGLNLARDKSDARRTVERARAFPSFS